MLVAALARQFLDHDAEPGAPRTGERYRFVIVQDAVTGETRGAVDEVSDTAVAEAACDAEVIDMRPGPTQGHSRRIVAPVLRRKLLHRAGWRCEVPGCRCLQWLDVHHLCARFDGGGNEVENLVVLCSGHHRAVHAGGLALECGADCRLTVTHRNGDSQRGPPRGRP